MTPFLKSFVASLLAPLVLVGILVLVLAMKLNQTPSIEEDSFLVVDIYGDLPEYAPPGGLIEEVVGDDNETLHRILTNLEMARVDDRIRGVILRMSEANGAGWASIEEIRGAIGKLQAEGKRVYGFSDSMDRRTYYLAAVCDSLYAPPTAYITFTGFAAVRSYVRGSLEKLGISANVHKIKDYKSAAELLTRYDMSPESRENTDWMLDEVWQVFMTTLQEDRGMTEEQVVACMEMAVMRADEAVEMGLFDEVLYWDELEDRLKGEDDEALVVVSQGRYAEESPEDLGLKGKKKVAVIHAHGLLGGRESRVDPVFGNMIGHATVNRDLRRAQKDKDVVAIVFRVDSNGGESLTSDLIGHAVEAAAADKPVVVSMVNVAASGGYSVSYRASKIVADPLTITGSIGSISMKFNDTEFFEKLGITRDYVTRGPMALFNSSVRDYTEQEWMRFTENHWEDFNAWLADIAEHRGLSFEEAELLAHGRVWTGRQAVANGLIDEVGGLDRAVEIAKELAEFPADEKVTLVHYPEEQELIDMVIGGGDDAAIALRAAMITQMRRDFAESYRLMTEATWNLGPAIELR